MNISGGYKSLFAGNYWSQSNLNFESWLLLLRAANRCAIGDATEPTQSAIPATTSIPRVAAGHGAYSSSKRPMRIGLQFSDEQYQWAPIIFDALMRAATSVGARLGLPCSPPLHGWVSRSYYRVADGATTGFINEGYFHWQGDKQWRVWFEAEPGGRFMVFLAQDLCQRA